MAGDRIELAKAYVRIVPTTRGIGAALNDELGGEANRAGRNAGGIMGSGLLKAFSATAGAAALGKIIKDSFNEGAAIEQSLGGIETMFKSTSGKVIANAETAYKRAGVSANKYMDQVTKFSASLLQSLDGDTEKAAEAADIAVLDMSDNSAKFGSDIQSIQDAYQGFAKQNYTMLDNLRLGYGGTKTEMERLLSDAEKLSDTPIDLDISNLSDVYKAIHIVQEDLEITGTTAEEASKTFSGSFAAAKASVQNFQATLTNGGDISKAFDNMTDSVDTFADNVFRMAETFAEQVGSLTYEKLIGSASDATKVIESMTAAALGFIGVYKLTPILQSLRIMNIQHALAAARELAKAKATELTNFHLSVQATLALKAAGAIGAAVAAGYALKSVIDKQTDAIDEAHDPLTDFSDTLQDWKAKQDDLSSSIADTAEQLGKSYKSADESAAGCEQMADRLQELNSISHRTTEEQAEYESLIKSLNDEVPDLNLEIDEQTGSLKNSNEEIKKIIDNVQKRAKAEAAQEHITELYKEQFAAQRQLTEAEERYQAVKSLGITGDYGGEIAAEYHAAATNMDAVNAALKEANSLIAANNTAIAESASKVQSVAVNTSLAEADMTSLSQTYDTATLSINNSAYTLSTETVAHIQGVAAEYQQMLSNTKESIFGAVNWFEKVPEQATVTADDLKKNMGDNLNYLTEWSDGIGKLADSGIDDGLLASLRDMGPSSLPYVQALNSMSEPELKEYSNQWKKAGEESEKAAENSLKNVKTAAAGEIQSIIENNDQQAIPIKDSFAMLGEYVMLGFKEGLEKNGDMVDDTARYTINSAYDAMAYEAKIKSPSRRAIELAEYIPQGLAIGILNGAGEVAEAGRRVMSEVFTEGEKATTFRPATWISPSGGENLAPAQPRTFSRYEPAGITLTLADEAGGIIARASAAASDLFSGSRAALAERGVAY